MVWKPRIRLGAAWGVVTLAAILLFDTWCVQRLRTAPIDLTLFFLSLALIVSVILIALILYCLYGLLTLSYTLDRNGLIIRWGALLQSIPMGNIERVAPASELGASTRFWGLAWPGYRIGPGQLKGVAPLRAYATRPLAKQLLVVTPSTVYGISPKDPQAFLADFSRRKNLGAAREMEQGTRRAKWTSLPFLGDRQAQALMLGGFLLNAGLFGHVCQAYPELPRLLSLHFDAFGEVDRVGARAELFSLPLIGLIVQVYDTLAGLLLHRRQATAAYLLFAAGLLVQVLLWAAVVNIVR